MSKENNKEALDLILDNALKIPGVKVSRTEYLTKVFSERVNSNQLIDILEKGPYEAGIKISEINNLAKSVIQKRTLSSTIISTGAGMPGGLAMAGTIPADVLQFFGTAIRLSQELAYLYGHRNLWLDEHLDTEKAREDLILYLGVMLGVGGSASLIKVLAAKISQELLEQLPKKALTKTVYYPIIKKIAGYIGYKITKDSFAKSASKVVPVVGGIVSGALTYNSMKPMGKRLATALYETLTLTEEDVYKEFKDLKKEFPDIIEGEFKEIDDSEEE